MLRRVTLVLMLPVLLLACPLGRGSKKLGEKCSAGNDCAEARCEHEVCTHACKSDGECAGAAVKMTCKGNVKTGTNPDAVGVCAQP